MKINQKQFNDALQSFKNTQLKDNIKKRIKSELITHVNNTKNHSIPSPYHHILKFFYKPIVATLILLFFVSGSIAFASESSLPGDLLYPIKTNITEPLVRLTKFSNKAKASFELKLADKRIREMAKLIKENKVTEEKTKENFVLLEKHISQYKQYENDIQGDSSVQSNLNVTIRLNDYKNLISYVSTSQNTTPPTNFYNNLLIKLPSLTIPTETETSENKVKTTPTGPNFINKLDIKIPPRDNIILETPIKENTDKTGAIINIQDQLNTENKIPLPNKDIPKYNKHIDLLDSGL